LNSLAGRVAVKYRDVFHTTQAAAKIVPALRVVTEKASLYVTRHLFRITTKTSGQAMFQTLLLHTLHPWR